MVIDVVSVLDDHIVVGHDDLHYSDIDVSMNDLATLRSGGAINTDYLCADADSDELHLHDGDYDAVVSRTDFIADIDLILSLD